MRAVSLCFALLVIVGCASLVNASAICQCTTAAATTGQIGETTVSSCDSCKSSSCPNMTSYTVSPVFGFSSGSSCTTDLSQFNVNDVEYNIVPDFLGNSCNQTSCCCLVGKVKVSRNANTMTVSGTATGQCLGADATVTYTSTLYGVTYFYVSNFITNGPTMIEATTSGLSINTFPSQCYMAADAVKKGLTGGQKAGIAFGVIIGVALVIGAVMFFIRRRRHHHYSHI